MQKSLVFRKSHTFLWSLFIVLVISLLQLTNAEAASVSAAKADQSTAETAGNDSLKTGEKGLVVEKVDGEIALNRTIRITIKDSSNWIKLQSSDRGKLLLYIDGVAFKFKNQNPVWDDNKVVLLYDLRRDEDNKAAWTTLLGRKGDKFCIRNVPVTVGIENQMPWPTKAGKVQFVRVDESRLNIFLGTLLVCIVTFLILAIKSDILRDTGKLKDESLRKMFSLARTQMALWSFVVIVGYVFIWIVTTDISSLTPGIVGLMGISSFTGLGSAVVDSSRKSDKKNKRKQLTDKRGKCELEVENLSEGISLLALKKSALPLSTNCNDQDVDINKRKEELAAKKKEIEQFEVAINQIDQQLEIKPSTGNFFKDILNDDDGVSVHRFQIFVWTIVLINIFIGRVIDTLTMPEFDAVLLGLMGISGGTYVGFKLPDQQG
jgi:hypothetical protein